MEVLGDTEPYSLQRLLMLSFLRVSVFWSRGYEDKVEDLKQSVKADLRGASPR